MCDPRLRDANNRKARTAFYRGLCARASGCILFDKYRYIGGGVCGMRIGSARKGCRCYIRACIGCIYIDCVHCGTLWCGAAQRVRVCHFFLVRLVSVFLIEELFVEGEANDRN